MSPVAGLTLLALATSVLAVPQGHGHNHQRLHVGHGSVASASASSYYSHGNATGSWRSLSSYKPTGSAAKPSALSSAEAPAGYGAPSGYAVSTASDASPAAQSSGAAVHAAGGSSSTCTDLDEVTMTSTEQITVYVTAGESAASPSSAEGVSSKVQSTVHTTISTILYSSPSSAKLSSSTTSSSEAAPVTHGTSSPSAPAYSAPAYTAPTSHASSAEAPSAPAYTAPSSQASGAEAAPTTHTTSSAEAPSAPAYTAPTTTSTWSSSVTTASSATSSALSIAIPSLATSLGDKAAATTSGAAAASSSASSSSGNSGKRGLAYNSAALTSCFSGSSQISWAYNWGSSSSGLSMSGVNFIPTMWGLKSDFTSTWAANAKAAISAGSKTLFSFNEPDLSAQANLSPVAAAAAYITYMMPFAGTGTKICAPSVTNGGGAMGLTWLSNFLAACPTCQIDCVNIHWYDSAENIDYFKSHVSNATKIANGRPVYVSEFGATGSDAQISSFLQEVMPWMDSQDSIAGYAYYMVADGMLTSGGEPSSYGTTYKTYTG